MNVMTPAATLKAVPNQPKTPMRSLRVTEEQWQLWHEAAKAEGLTLSDYIRAVMDRNARRTVRKAR